MASAWGGAWGDAWGDSWGTREAVKKRRRGFFFRQFVGYINAVLPPLVGDARGVHSRQGGAFARLAPLSARARGQVGVSGAVELGFDWTAEAAGRVNVSGRALGNIELISIGRGAQIKSGAGVGDIRIDMEIVGDHDPDEPAILALMRAA